MKKILLMLSLVLCMHSCRADVKKYEEQVAYDPSDHRALYNVGVTAFKENDLEKAQAAFDCLKPLCKDEAWGASKHEQLFYNAGNTEVKLQNYAEAVASFEEVLKVNPDNELAQKKLEFAKKMLEQQQQEQQQQGKQDNQDQQNQQDQKKNDQGQDDKQDNSQSDKQDKDSQDTDEQQSQDQDGQDKESNNDNQSGDQQQDDKQNDQLDQQDSKSSQDGDQNQDDNDQQQQGVGNNTEQGDQQEEEKQNQGSDQQEPELNKEEQQLLAALQGYDQKMNKEMGQRMLRAAKGAHDKNNW